MVMAPRDGRTSTARGPAAHRACSSGFVLLGVGVVPMGVIGGLLEGGELAAMARGLLLMLVVTFLFRGVGVWLLRSGPATASAGAGTLLRDIVRQPRARRSPRRVVRHHPARLPVPGQHDVGGRRAPARECRRQPDPSGRSPATRRRRPWPPP